MKARRVGTRVRPLVVSGDGAFQVTGPEIVRVPRHGVGRSSS